MDLGWIVDPTGELRFPIDIVDCNVGVRRNAINRTLSLGKGVRGGNPPLIVLPLNHYIH